MMVSPHGPTGSICLKPPKRLPMPAARTSRVVDVIGFIRSGKVSESVQLFNIYRPQTDLIMASRPRVVPAMRAALSPEMLIEVLHRASALRTGPDGTHAPVPREAK